MMYQRVAIKILALTVIFSICVKGRKTPDEYDIRKARRAVQDMMHKYQCWKTQRCIRENKLFCAFDEYSSKLVKFKDICDMYDNNCNRNTYYRKVDMIVCDIKVNYMKENPKEQFQWQPVPKVPRKPYDPKKKLPEVLRRYKRHNPDQDQVEEKKKDTKVTEAPPGRVNKVTTDYPWMKGLYQYVQGKWIKYYI